MAGKIDRDVLEGFVEEARGYLPRILSGIETARTAASRDSLEEMHRLLHSIKGASSMVGLVGLSHIAYHAEETIDEVIAGRRALTPPVASLLQRTVGWIGEYLTRLDRGVASDQRLLGRAITAYRRLRGEPESGDEAELRLVLGSGEDSANVGETAATAADDLPQPGMVAAIEYPMLRDSRGQSAEEEILEPEDLPARFHTERIEEQSESPPPALPQALDTGSRDEDRDVAEDLLEAFLLEAEEHLQNVSAVLRALEKQPGDHELLLEVRRSIHTLKGAGATVGLPAVTQLSHRMEDFLDHAVEASVELDSEHLDLLHSTADTLADLCGPGVEEEILAGLYRRYGNLLAEPGAAEARPSEVRERSTSVSAAALETSPPPAAGPSNGSGESNGMAAISPPAVGREAAEEEQQPRALVSASREPASAAGERAPAAPAAASSSSSHMVRVPIERLDELVRLVSELLVNRSTFEQYFAHLRGETTELRLSVERLGRVSSRVETDYEVLALDSGNTRGRDNETIADFDELEMDRYTAFHLLSRELSEASADIRSVDGEIHTTLGDFDGYLTRLSRLTSEIQDKLMRLRMVPLAQLVSRLHRSVRVSSRQQGKRVELTVQGERVELEKTVLEEIANPLLHILRNAVFHGIEPPALRQANNKPEVGQIHLRASYQGTQVVIEVSDDGAGLDTDRLLAAAVEGGYVDDSEASLLSHDELHQMIFLPGLSTSGEVSELAGRGVGLDIVRSSVQRLNGTLSVDSIPLQGTTFTVRLPMTLAISRVLMVESAGYPFAIPLSAISQIQRMDKEEIRKLGQEPVVRLENGIFPVHYLHKLLGLEVIGEPPDRFPVLFLSLGRKRIALAIDRILEAREVVVKTLGTLLRRVHGVSGATLMGDGSVVLILNPEELMQEKQRHVSRSQIRIPAVQRRSLDVFIVDDSVSVRRVLTNLIKSAGWNPVTARDGQEALEKLQRTPTPPDIMLLDIEMPRMDGYELTSTLRSEPSFKSLPIIMVTSRAGEKHRRRAFEVGATEYLVKPYQDETLLGVIRRLREAKDVTPS